MECVLPCLPLAQGASLPQYATPGAAAMDLCAAPGVCFSLEPGRRAVVPTGLAVAVPEGHVGLIFARSGLALKQGLCLANGVGVIDSDYRGELCVALLNLGESSVTIRAGDRIAQLALLPVCRALPTVAQALEPTRRGEGGFGSTGIGRLQGGDSHGL